MLKLVNFVNLNFLFTSLTSCPSVQKSSLPCCCRHVAMKFWCQSSIKFDRLRSFLVIHRVFTIIPPFFGGVQVRSSSIKFDQVRSSSIKFDRVRSSSTQFNFLRSCCTSVSRPRTDSAVPLKQATNRHGSARSDRWLRGDP